MVRSCPIFADTHRRPNSIGIISIKIISLWPTMRFMMGWAWRCTRLLTDKLCLWYTVGSGRSIISMYILWYRFKTSEYATSAVQRVHTLIMTAWRRPWAQLDIHPLDQSQCDRNPEKCWGYASHRDSAHHLDVEGIHTKKFSGMVVGLNNSDGFGNNELRDPFSSMTHTSVILICSHSPQMNRGISLRVRKFLYLYNPNSRFFIWSRTHGETHLQAIW